MRFGIALAAVVALATTASASWFGSFRKPITPGPNSRLSTSTEQQHGLFAKVRNAQFHIAALNAPIYQHMRQAWKHLRAIQWAIILQLPKVDEQDHDNSIAAIKGNLVNLDNFRQRIDEENKRTTDDFLRLIVNGQLVAFKAKLALVKTYLKIVDFLVFTVRPKFAVFKRGVAKVGRQAYKQTRNVGGMAVNGAKFVGGKAVAGGKFVGGKTVDGVVAVHGGVKSIWEKLREFMDAVKAKGESALYSWAGLDQEDYFQLDEELADEFTVLETTEEQTLEKSKNKYATEV